MLKIGSKHTPAGKAPSKPEYAGALNENEPVTERKYATVKQMLTLRKYGWATESFLRHAIFQAEGRVGSGGAVVPGNGLAPAILRIGRKVLIDLYEFDHWIEQQRMQPVRSRVSGDQ